MRTSIQVSLCVLLLYLMCLTVNIAKDYRCEPSWVRYRMDYIFPARQISCFLYQEVTP